MRRDAPQHTAVSDALVLHKECQCLHALTLEEHPKQQGMHEELRRQH